MRPAGMSKQAGDAGRASVEVERGCAAEEAKSREPESSAGHSGVVEQDDGQRHAQTDECHDPKQDKAV